ncbi:MAG: hypothetical protein U9P14_11910, partial [Gemmatimonadota bacterium]|nr:hypothetical protein [Gemmatimonadota bacterium]
MFYHLAQHCFHLFSDVDYQIGISSTKSDVLAGIQAGGATRHDACYTIFYISSVDNDTRCGISYTGWIDHDIGLGISIVTLNHSRFAVTAALELDHDTLIKITGPGMRA